MAFCNVKNPPEYTTEIRKWDRETWADGREMGNGIEQLFNNTYYNKTNKVDKNGGDISDTMVTADKISEEFPVPSTEEKTKSFLGKVKKSMEDWKDFKNGIVTLGMLSNQYINSTDKIPTSALVYALKQVTDQLNTDLTKRNEIVYGAGTLYPGLKWAGNSIITKTYRTVRVSAVLMTPFANGAVMFKLSGDLLPDFEQIKKIPVIHSDNTFDFATITIRLNGDIVITYLLHDAPSAIVPLEFEYSRLI